MSPPLPFAAATLLGAALCLPGGSDRVERGLPRSPTAATPTADRASPAPSSAALQRAWLREVLDLDPVGAAEDYARIAADDRPGHFARWVAIARLVELQRLDAIPAHAIDASDAPAVLRPHFEENDTTLDMQPLLRRLIGDPAQVLNALATEDGHLPTVRPLVPAAEDWVVEQIGPNRAELLDRQRRTRSTFGPRAPFNDLRYAVWVLRAELDGQRAVAEERRSIHFAQWQPPAVADDDEQILLRFRHHIEALISGSEWTGSWRELHRRLRDEVERRAASDPADAVAFLRRLPYYAERLLAPVPPKER